MNRFSPSSSLALLLVLAVLFLTATTKPLQAHFQLNVNIRVIHVEHNDSGLLVYYRVPMAYLVANLVGEERADGTRAPAPYTTNSMEDGELMHRLDIDAFYEDPIGLGTYIANGHAIKIGDQQSEGLIEVVRVYPALAQPPFANLDEAKDSFDKQIYPDNIETPFVGDTIVDAIISYAADTPVRSYSISSTLDPGLEDQDQTANLILDHYGSEPLVFRERGMLQTPVMIEHSLFAAALTFVKEGIRHILEGIDHVVFVVCLALGASTFSSLAWRVTGFTLGHSITLSIGFSGYVPKGEWFVPAVETGIALSIIYAAVMALLKKERGSTTGITVLIGLLHGLGFSFVLNKILRIDASNVWQSLVAFNIGVEVGQILIVLLCWPIFNYVSNRNWRLSQMLPWVVALPCIIFAAVITGQRIVQFASAL